MVLEYDTALKTAKFADDAGKAISMTPATWQVELGYQFDWNPWVEEIGQQGGFRCPWLLAVPRPCRGHAHYYLRANQDRFRATNRLIATAGEWFLEGGRVALEYSHDWDYPVSKGGVREGRVTDFSSEYNVQAGSTLILCIAGKKTGRRQMAMALAAKAFPKSVHVALHRMADLCFVSCIEAAAGYGKGCVQ